LELLFLLSFICFLCFSLIALIIIFIPIRVFFMNLTIRYLNCLLKSLTTHYHHQVTVLPFELNYQTFFRCCFQWSYPRNLDCFRWHFDSYDFLFEPNDWIRSWIRYLFLFESSLKHLRLFCFWDNFLKID